MSRPSSRGFHAVKWIETHCRHTGGESLAKPFRLLPWQREFLLRLFELRPDNSRRYRRAYLSCAKKNGKTELSAAIALYLLLNDDGAPRVAIAAVSDDQADLAFGAARAMCELSPTLRAVTEVSERRIRIRNMPSAELVRFTGASGSNDGRNLAAVIADELHEWPRGRGEDLFRILEASVVGRRQPLTLMTTTAGNDPEGIAAEQYAIAVGVRDGTIVDETFLPVIWEAPVALDIRDPATWALANPSLGVLVTEEALADQLNRQPEGAFRRYNLNQWVAFEAGWLPAGAWEGCADAQRELDPALPVAIGVDFAWGAIDTAAVVVAQYQPDGACLVRARVWANPYPPSHPSHADWRLEPEAVAAHVRSLAEQFPAAAARHEETRRLHAGPIVAVDPYGLGSVLADLVDAGINVIEVPQTAGYMAPATATLIELVKGGRLVHDGDPALTAHVANAVLRETRDGGYRLAKLTKSTRKPIDAAVAMAMAVQHAPTEPPRPVTRKPRIAVGF